MRRLFVFFLFFSVLMISSFYAEKIKIEKKNGLTVIYNPKKLVSLSGAPSKLILTEDLSIGDKTDDKNYMFYRLRSIQVDDEENIFILDDKEVCIKAFDSNGTFIRKLIRKGQAG